MYGHIVIAGGGQAAVQAVDTLRRKGFTGKLSMVGDEPWLPYQRPPLSKKYRSEEHTSEPSHTVISYAVFCLKKKKKTKRHDGSVQASAKQQEARSTAARISS